MRWLIRLSCPPDGLVLDPFAGSGSTGVACLAERRRFLGIERKSDFAEIARARLTHAARKEVREQEPVDGRPADGTRGSVRRTPINPFEVIGGIEP